MFQCFGEGLLSLGTMGGGGGFAKVALGHSAQTCLWKWELCSAAPEWFPLVLARSSP